MTATPLNVILPEKEEWGEIGLAEEETPKMPLSSVFGESFSQYLQKLSRATGTPIDYVALSLLVMSSVIIGNKRTIYVRNGWTDEPVHLWGALVGVPSAKKTVSVKIIKKALRRLVETRKMQYLNQKSIYRSALQRFNQSGGTDEEPKKPIMRQLIINDSTVEAIHRVIDPENPECVCVFRDELTGLMGALSKYNNGDRSFFLEGYNGAPYNINRVKYDEPILISKLSLSILGTIQPQKLKSLLREADDGFISRLLFAFPDPIFSEEPDFEIDEGKIRIIFEKLDQISSKHQSISLDEKAKEIFNQWHRENEIETQKCIDELLQSSYGKMGGQSVRLACSLEHIFWALSEEKSGKNTDDKPENPPKLISKDTILKAIVLIEDYFKPMAEKVFCDCLHPRADNVQRSFLRYLKDQKLEKFNVRELKHRNVFPKNIDENEFLTNLIELNVIRRDMSGFPPKGRPSKNYVVNPKLMEMKL